MKSKQDLDERRYAYRDALIRKGVPDVIAVMASENTNAFLAWLPLSYSADKLILHGFWWKQTPQGHDFWDAIYEECRHV